MQTNHYSPARFVKKISNWTSKECFYYVCADHYPKGADSSDEEWPSGASDDQMDEASEDEKKKKKVHKKQKKVPPKDKKEEESDSSDDELEGKGSSEDEPVDPGNDTSDDSELDTD